jgi:DNA repair exonuclease SbcCD ATPase subunit
VTDECLHRNTQQGESLTGKRPGPLRCTDCGVTLNYKNHTDPLVEFSQEVPELIAQLRERDERLDRAECNAELRREQIRERDAEIERLKRQIENMNANLVDAVTWSNTYDQLRIAREELNKISYAAANWDGQNPGQFIELLGGIALSAYDRAAPGKIRDGK